MSAYSQVAIQVPNTLESRIIHFLKFSDDENMRRPQALFHLKQSQMSIFVWDWNHAPDMSDFTDWLENELKIDFPDYYIEEMSEFDEHPWHDGSLRPMFELKGCVYNKDSIIFHESPIYEKDFSLTMTDDEFKKYYEEKLIKSYWQTRCNNLEDIANMLEDIKDRMN